MRVKPCPPLRSRTQETRGATRFVSRVPYRHSRAPHTERHPCIGTQTRRDNAPSTSLGTPKTTEERDLRCRDRNVREGHDGDGSGHRRRRRRPEAEGGRRGWRQEEHNVSGEIPADQARRRRGSQGHHRYHRQAHQPGPAAALAAVRPAGYREDVHDPRGGERALRTAVLADDPGAERIRRYVPRSIPPFQKTNPPTQPHRSCKLTFSHPHLAQIAASTS